MSDGDSAPDREKKSLHEAPTSGTGGGSSAGFPPAGRYRIDARLGGGGMGEVFRAFDPTLDRQVALKFLKGDDPTLLARFEQEARAQARLEHEHICKVYEVGAAAGRHYIAMQYVAGDTLRDVAWKMTLEQKVAVMRDVADAVHSAHKLGLIHRDIKPSNVMVERTEEGRFVPFVMDFGIVRDQASEGMTLTGVIVGTPGFMAPEQLRAREGGLDRRADVYGLGATLYALFAGRPPFGEEATLDVMVRVLESDPPPLSKAVPDIPRDLETVVMKCLEKEPPRRYDSARALAEDLQRYLDGEAVAARRATISYRLAKKARKHRALVSVTAIACLLLALLGGYSLRSRWAAGRREQLAQRFGQEIREIESVLRIAHLLPLHDTRREKDLVRSKMASIGREGLGDAGRGPAAYAIGQGHLVLGDHARARPFLEEAWARGYRTPEVAYALGQVLGALYRVEVQEAARLATPELTAERRAVIARELLVPALEYLRQSRGAELEAPEYLEALLAFYEKRYDQALARAQAAYAHLPWLYEAKQLAGEVYEAQGDELGVAGDYDAAAALFAKAEAAYAAALEIGKSDGRVAEDLANLHLLRMEMEIYGPDRDVAGHFQRGLAACSAALASDPDSVEALRYQSSLFARMAEYERDHGGDPRPRLQDAIAAGERSVRLVPTVRGYVSLEEAFRIQADYELERGIDPAPTVHRAEAAYRRALDLQATDPDVHNSMGIAFRALAGYEGRHGRDPRANLRRAIDAYRKAIERNKAYAYPYNNAGNAWAELAAYELDHGGDPRPLVDEVRRSCARAAELNPSFPYPPNNVASALNTQARYEMRHGLDPRPSLEQAIAHALKSAAVKADFASAWANLAQSRAIRAEFEWLQGRSTDADVAAGIEAGGKALAIRSQMPAAHAWIAWAQLVAARRLLEAGVDPAVRCASAAQSARRALEADRAYFEAHRIAGLAALVDAQWRLARGLDATSALAQARASLEAARGIKPEDGRSYEALAELCLWQARFEQRQGRPARATLEEGLARSAEAVARDPSLAEAAALRGLLLLAQAKTAAPADAAALADAGRQALRHGIDLNANLARRYAAALP